MAMSAESIPASSLPPSEGSSSTVTTQQPQAAAPSASTNNNNSSSPASQSATNTNNNNSNRANNSPLRIRIDLSGNNNNFSSIPAAAAATPPIPLFPLAAQPDIVRAAQKDEFYMHYLHAQVRDLCAQWLGSRILMKYEHEIKLLSDLSYYAITTCIGQQTLGEEYCDITQVAQNNNNTSTTSTSSKQGINNNSNIVSLVGTARRLYLVSLSVVFPYGIKKLLQYAARHATTERTRNILEGSKSVMQFAVRMNLGIFYMTGVYLEMSKRFARVNYVSSVS